MSFEIDEKTLMISGYKGDSASFVFKTEQDLSGINVYFYIKKYVNDPEDKAVIVKEFENPRDGLIDLKLTPEDTNKLGLTGCCFRDYYWSLKIKRDNNFVQTVIPNDFVSMPVFRVYP